MCCAQEVSQLQCCGKCKPPQSYPAVSVCDELRLCRCRRSARASLSTRGDVRGRPRSQELQTYWADIMRSFSRPAHCLELHKLHWMFALRPAGRCPSLRSGGAKRLSAVARADMVARVGIVTTVGCPYCKKAKAALKDAGVEYDEAELGSARDVLAKVKETTSQSTVPQV
jgi:Glutaredoxin